MMPGAQAGRIANEVVLSARAGILVEQPQAYRAVIDPRLRFPGSSNGRRSRRIAVGDVIADPPATAATSRRGLRRPSVSYRVGARD